MVARSTTRFSQFNSEGKQIHNHSFDFYDMEIENGNKLESIPLQN